MMIISLRSLQSLFKRSGNGASIKYHSECHKCGHRVKIEIVQTAGGFGLQGGVLHESNTASLHAECENCYKNVSKSGQGRKVSLAAGKIAG
jgi:hypothetical protein